MVWKKIKVKVSSIIKVIVTLMILYEKKNTVKEKRDELRGGYSGCKGEVFVFNDDSPLRNSKNYVCNFGAIK